MQQSGVAADLAYAIPRGNHRQDRLEPRAAENLDSPLLDQLGQPVEILGLVGREPFQERSADVKRNLQRGVAAEHVEEVAIAVVVRLLEYVVEVADGLMIVDREDQANGVGHDALVAAGSGELSPVKPRSVAAALQARCGNNYSIGNNHPDYPVCLVEKVFGSGNSTSTSRKNAAACSGGTGLM